MIRRLPSLADWIAVLMRMSGKSLMANTSMTPQAWFAESPNSARPSEPRTALRAPSQPATSRALTVSTRPSWAGSSRSSRTVTR
jgi:hypothetical protein